MKNICTNFNSRFICLLLYCICKFFVFSFCLKCYVTFVLYLYFNLFLSGGPTSFSQGFWHGVFGCWRSASFPYVARRRLILDLEVMQHPLPQHNHSPCRWSFFSFSFLSQKMVCQFVNGFRDRIFYIWRIIGALEGPWSFFILYAIVFLHNVDTLLYKPWQKSRFCFFLSI